MARPEGLAKTGGRKKGTPNKKTVGLQEALVDHGINVVERLAASLEQLPIEKQVDTLMGLLSFLYPKRKAVEVIEQQDSTSKDIKIEFIGRGNSTTQGESDGLVENTVRTERILKYTRNLIQFDKQFGKRLLDGLDDNSIKQLGLCKMPSKSE